MVELPRDATTATRALQLADERMYADKTSRRPSAKRHARDLLVYRVLGRDQAAIVDLVRDVLTPLDQVRGGAEVLLETLQAYFDAGEVATEAARVARSWRRPCASAGA